MNIIPTESSDIKTILPNVNFYTPADLIKLTGWSSRTVHKLFNDPKFPSSNYGKVSVILEHALIEYFSVRHDKAKEKYWR